MDKEEGGASEQEVIYQNFPFQYPIFKQYDHYVIYFPEWKLKILITTQLQQVEGNKREDEWIKVQRPGQKKKNFNN